MIMDQQTKTILCWHTQNHKELINNSCPRAMSITIKSIRPQIQQWVYMITSCFENKLWRQFCSPFCIQYKMIGLCSILIKLMEKKTYIHTIRIWRHVLSQLLFVCYFIYHSILKVFLLLLKQLNVYRCSTN